MRFKDGAIKPGMVIHCPTEEDARVLLEHLGCKYEVYPWTRFEEQSCYEILDSKRLYLREMEYFGSYPITEFSDLLEPDSSTDSSARPLDSSTEMSAVKVLEWLRDNDGKRAMKDVFGCTFFNAVMDSNSAKEVVDAITAYEAAKSKPVEPEWVNVCKIYRVYDKSNSRVWVRDVELSDGERKIPTEEILRKYMAEHTGNYYATVERRCRVKGDQDERI